MEIGTMLSTEERLSRFLSLIEEEKHASPEGVELRVKLEHMLGKDHPSLKSADRRIAQIPVLKAQRTC